MKLATTFLISVIFFFCMLSFNVVQGSTLTEDLLAMLNNDNCTHGQTQGCSTGLLGICGQGTQTCVQGNWSSCSQLNVPTTEICENSIDEDCDGQDAICTQCPSVYITNKCLCENDFYETGYCCNFGYDSDSCVLTPGSSDLNNDEITDINDFVLFAKGYNTPAFDLDDDDETDLSDLTMLARVFRINNTNATSILIDADFEITNDSFTYVDDLFTTNNANAQDGSRVTSTNCPEGSCLEVNLNINNPITNANPLSGGWSTDFMLNFASDVLVTFDYQLRLDGETEINQNEIISLRLYDLETSSQIIIDGLEHDRPGNDSLQSGSYSGSFTLNAGTYDLEIGCYLTSVSAENENGQCWVDNVVVSSGLDNSSCGNNIVDSGENCDNGINNGLVCSAPYGGTCNYCSNSCSTITVTGPFCGDDMCDNGETSSTCSVDCTAASICGNNIIESGEDCDDGSSNGQVCIAPYDSTCDYCSNTCSTVTVNGPFCGDGSCSDGETTNSCSADCANSSSDIIVSENFDGSTTIVDIFLPATDSSLSTEESYSGSTSLKMCAGLSCKFSYRYYLPDNADTLYGRYMFKVGNHEEWFNSDGSPKTQEHYKNPGFEGGTNACKGNEHFGPGADDCVTVRTRLITPNYGIHSEGLSGIFNHVDQNVNVIDGNWHCIEIMLKLNTPGQADGEVKYWVDGNEHIVDGLDEMRADYSWTVDKWWWTYWSNDNWLGPTYLDDFVVSKSRIGCP